MFFPTGGELSRTVTHICTHRATTVLVGSIDTHVPGAALFSTPQVENFLEQLLTYVHTELLVY